METPDHDTKRRRINETEPSKKEGHGAASAAPGSDGADELVSASAQLEKEPVLPVDDIQGDIILGFNKAFNLNVVVDFKLPEPTPETTSTKATVEAAAEVKRWLLSVLGLISTTEDVLKHRDQHRKTGYKSSDCATTALINVAFSFDCINALVTDTEFASTLFEFPPDSAFVVGAANRAGVLGDPPDKSKRKHPCPKEDPGGVAWKFGADKQNSIAINIASDSKDAVFAKLVELKLSPKWTIVDQTLSHRGTKGTDPLYGHEAYGFMDGLSQPEVRGTYEHTEESTGVKEKAFVVKRRLSPKDGRYTKYSRPGFQLCDTGHFLLGEDYLKATDDVNDPAMDNPLPDAYRKIVAPYPDWCKNGTFVVYRRLAQDVHGFWNNNLNTAEKACHGLNVGDETLRNIAGDIAAQCIGRWWDGTPLVGFDAPLSGLHYPPNLEKMTEAAKKHILKSTTEQKDLKNGFSYASPQSAWQMADGCKVGPGKDKPYPSDPIGAACPFAAHIRKVNPRDEFTDIGGNMRTLKHRIIRRGNNYGSRVKDVFAPAPAHEHTDERGLALVMYMSSIEDQFEFVQRHWANASIRPKGADSDDIVIGLPEDKLKSFTVSVTLPVTEEGKQEKKQVPLVRPAAFTRTSGMGYFLMPAKSAIKHILCADAVSVIEAQSDTGTERQLLRTPAGNKDFKSLLLYRKWDWTLKYMFWQCVWATADQTAVTSQYVLPAFLSSMAGAGIAYRLPDVDDLAKHYGNPTAPNSSTYLQFRNPIDLEAMREASKESNPKFIQQVIAWQAFPRRIKDLFSNSDQNPYEYVETIGWPANDVTYRNYTPQPLARQGDEYCEWFTHRNAEGKITRVDITCEPPEYWAFLFQNEPQTCLKLYQKYVSPLVRLEDLQNVDGSYNIYNRFNTEMGAMHLNCPANSLFAELFIAAEAATRWGSPGNPIVDGGQLIKCAKYGLPTRASDPTIGEVTNELIRSNYILSIEDPVGLYLQELDVTGWTRTDGSVIPKADIDAIVTYERGSGDRSKNLRVRIEVPATYGYELGDILIGGVPITWAGQIIDASCTMFLTGVAIKGTDLTERDDYLKKDIATAVVPCKGKWGPGVGPTPIINPKYPRPEPPADLLYPPDEQ